MIRGALLTALRAAAADITGEVITALLAECTTCLQYDQSFKLPPQEHEEDTKTSQDQIENERSLLRHTDAEQIKGNDGDGDRQREENSPPLIECEHGITIFTAPLRPDPGLVDLSLGRLWLPTVGAFEGHDVIVSPIGKQSGMRRLARRTSIYGILFQIFNVAFWRFLTSPRLKC